MHPTIEKLIANGAVVTDGAWGTQLQARGLAIGEFPDAWNITHPQFVSEVARSYVNAGSRVILTNTFGANRIRLAENSLADRVLEINQRGVEISKIAASGKAVVFASIGPTGKLLMNGDIAPAEMQSAFEEQATALAQGGAGAIVVETMADLEETKLAVVAARSTGLPVVACMVFDSGKNLDRTMMGTTPEQAAQVLSASGADVIGANCGQGISHFLPICQRLRAATDRPIWIKPNAGLPQLENGHAVYAGTPADFADQATGLIAAGATFIGGCCGTSPEFISAISRRIAG